MTPDEEMQLLRLQKRNAELTAENVKLRSRIKDLQRLHENNQDYIGKLQAQQRRRSKTLAEQVFNGEEKT